MEPRGLMGGWLAGVDGSGWMVEWMDTSVSLHSVRDVILFGRDVG